MTQHDIFLSYSRTDTPMMQKVRDYLREQGFKVWTDEGIHAGTPSWKTAIEDAKNAGLCVYLAKAWVSVVMVFLART
jgi:hypothetical protein